MPNNDPEWLKQHLATMKACQVSEEQELADLRNEYKRLILQHKHLLERFKALDEMPPGEYCPDCQEHELRMEMKCTNGCVTTRMNKCGVAGCDDPDCD